jgi:hypothetical protein
VSPRHGALYVRPIVAAGGRDITVADAVMSDDQRIRFRVLSRIAPAVQLTTLGATAADQRAILDWVKARTCAGADRLATSLPCAPPW